MENVQLTVSMAVQYSLAGAILGGLLGEGVEQTLLVEEDMG